MPQISQNKLARKLLLLAALAASLAYLRKPGHAQAQDCVQQCVNEEIACAEKCDDNLTCLNNCADEERLCIAQCM
jgi:hypothetical protein